MSFKITFFPTTIEAGFTEEFIGIFLARNVTICYHYVIIREKCLNTFPKKYFFTITKLELFYLCSYLYALNHFFTTFLNPFSIFQNSAKILCVILKIQMYSEKKVKSEIYYIYQKQTTFYYLYFLSSYVGSREYIIYDSSGNILHLSNT